MVQNIDYAPSFLGAAGIKPPSFMQGIDLVPLVTGKTKNIGREYLYYHFYEYKADHTVLQHLGIRGDRYKLIYFYPVNEWELYDLKKDPRELKNIYHSSQHREIFKQMKAALLQVRDKYDDHETAGELH